MSPPILHELGFLAAVRWLVRDFQGRYGLNITVDDDNQPKPMQKQISTVMYRSVRELLINVAKHAQTDRAWICVRRDGDTVRVSIEDRGCGFEPQTALGAVGSRPGAGGYGLFSIREQLSHLGGSMQIRSAPGEETAVSLTVPLLHEPDELGSELR